MSITADVYDERKRVKRLEFSLILAIITAIFTVGTYANAFAQTQKDVATLQADNKELKTQLNEITVTLAEIKTDVKYLRDHK